MRKSYHRFHSVLFLILMFPAFIFAGWYKIHDNPGSVSFNSAMSYTYDLSFVYIAASDGWFYSTHNQGNDWNGTQVFPGKNLYGIGNSQKSDSTFIFVCGANGALARYYEPDDVWLTFENVTDKNLFAVQYNYSRYETWVVGDSNFIAVSRDAIHWQRLSVPGPVMNIKSLFFTYQKTILMGDDGNNIYIHYLNSQPDSQVTDDFYIPLENYQLITVAQGSGESSSDIYFLAKNRATDEVHLMQFNIYDAEPQITDLSTISISNAKSLGIYSNYNSPKQYFWIGTSSGDIWESVRPDYGSPLGEWHVIYHEPDGFAINAFITSEQEGLLGMALGSDELVLLNSFQIKEVNPPPNAVVNTPENEVRIRFSTIPNVYQLQTNSFIFSNYFGFLNFNISYDPSDSTVAVYRLNRNQPSEAVPGETWDFAFSRGIYALGDTAEELSLTPIQYSNTFGQMHEAPFTYVPDQSVYTIKHFATNWVAGFFNSDDLIDLVTFANDSLYCYYRTRISEDSVVQNVYRKSFPELIQIDKHIYHQLITANVNNDDLPDLIIYDQNAVHFLINRSTENGIDFELTNNQYSQRNIRQVVAYNDDNTAQTDLLVLGNSLNIVYNIFPDVQQFNTSTIYYDAYPIQMVAVGNVDDNLANDLVMIWNGKIVYRSGSATYGLNYGSEADTLTGDMGYYSVKLANLDNDNKLEILAMSPTGLDIIPLYHNVVIGGTKTASIGSGIQFNPNASPPSDFIVQDFGGNPITDFINPLDIAILQEDSLFIYQNQTAQQNNFVFSNGPVFKTQLGNGQNPYDRLSYCDYNADGTLNIIATDYETGTAEILGKPLWKPTLQLVNFDAYHVQLQWDPAPPDMGVLDHYEIIKKTNFDTTKVRIFVNENTYTDLDVFPLSDYSYSVQAIYQNQQVSPVSNRIDVRTYHELNSPLSGILADTTLPYWAKSNIKIPSGDSLRILPGVQLYFNHATGLDVEGKLLIAGDSSYMVEFHSRDSLWNGVRLFNAADTVRLFWFSISDAAIAVQSNGRPFKLQYCGLIHNQTGIQTFNSDFYAENFVIDSCLQGILLGQNSRAYLKNIDILHTRDNCIYAKGTNAQAWIRNAIIWQNRTPITAEPQSQIRIRYSTVDSIGANVIATNISHLAPIFLSGTEEDPPFRADPMSPTIDAGDPNDDFSLEPAPNGGRINQGVFGNSPFATPSLQPRGKLYALRVNLRCFPNDKDSTLAFVKNWGHVPLEIQDIRLLHSGENGPFVIEHTNITQGIEPQDSLGFKLWFNPVQRGLFTDSLIVTCNDPHLENGRMFLALKGQGLNSKPHVVNTPLTEAYVDSPYVYVPIIEDADGDSVTVTPLLIPHWLSWAKGTLSGTPAVSDTGLHPVRLKLDDHFGGLDTLRFVIKVKRIATQPVVLFPVLKVYPVGGLLSTQAAIRFRITVLDSTENWVRDSTQSYHIRITLHQIDGPDSIRIDTTGVKELTFTHLTDGKYLASFLAFKRVEGRLLAKKATAQFTIRASQKTTKRFLWIMASLPRSQTFSPQELNIPDSSAVFFRWNPQTEEYDQLMPDAEIQPGAAFWIMPLKFLHIDLNSFPIEPAVGMDEQEFNPTIQLQPGWNQIGLPLPYFERWIDCRITGENGELTWQQAFQDSLLSEAVYWFEQSKEYIGYHPEPIDSATVAIPWRGYWIFSKTELTLRIPNEPYFQPSAQSLDKPSALMKVKGDQNAFLVNLTVACDNYRDDYNVFGLSSLKTAKLPEPPYFKNFAALSFEGRNGSFCKDVKTMPEATDAVVSWDVMLRTTQTGKNHHLQWATVSTNSEPLYMYLVDPETETVINMNDKTEYDFTPKKPEHKLRIYVSKDDHFKPAIIPLQYKLSQNFPNPFNPTTTIRVGIPESGKNQRVSLKIYDLLGKEVKTLADGPLQPGYHKFTWDGTNYSGNPVSSGIYFYQLRAGRKSIMHKMILLR